MQLEKYLFETGWRKQSGGNWKHPDNKNFRYVFYNITLRFEQKIDGVWRRVSSGVMENLRLDGKELKGMR